MRAGMKPYRAKCSNPLAEHRHVTTNNKANQDINSCAHRVGLYLERSSRC
jgi:hypothetical protein